MRSADVSVILPAFRAEATIRRALASVAAQTLRPKEVVVIDDGSSDRTADEARAMAGALGSITLRVFRQDHAGPGAARNRALREATGTFVAFLDADDEWLPAKIARSIAFLTEDLVLVAHDGIIVSADGAQSLNACAQRFVEHRDPFVTLYRKGFIDTCSVVARRDTVIAVGGFDESLPNAQDFDLWLKMLAQPGNRFLVFAEALVRYHLTPGSVMSHVDRRLACCLTIAGRYIPALKARPGAVLASVIFRGLAIHHEAAVAHWGRGRLFNALRVLLSAPLHLLGLTLDTLLPNRDVPARKPILAAAWLWIVFAATAYLVQFRGLIDPILRALGIA
ncbi:MAG: glycosyltransferase family 2 protein [Rhodospirillales bacterium]|nr:glycosyltransferase family 2 protein [Rhodospirillales bacterium]